MTHVPGPGSGWRPVLTGPSLAAVAPDRDDVVPRVVGRADRGVQPRVVDAGDQGQPVGAAVHAMVDDDRAVAGIDERRRLRRWRPRPGRRRRSRRRAASPSPMAARRSSGSRRRPGRRGRPCRRRRRGSCASSRPASPPISSASSAATAAGPRSSDGVATRAEPVPPGARSAMPGQVERGRDRAGSTRRRSTSRSRRGGHDGRPVVGHEQVRPPAGRRGPSVGRRRGRCRARPGPSRPGRRSRSGRRRSRRSARSRSRRRPARSRPGAAIVADELRASAGRRSGSPCRSRRGSARRPGRPPRRRPPGAARWPRP